MPLVLGVDSSTQATKVELRDADDGSLVAGARAPHPATAPPRSEQHPDAWWAALGEVLATPEVAAHLGEVAAVSVAGQQHGLVVTDEAGAPIRPAKLWNDTESAPEAAGLVEALGAAAWADAVGSVPTASFTVTKVAWLARHEPEALAAAAHLHLPHDHLTWRLGAGPDGGPATTDRGDASGTGWWSPAEDEVRLDLLALAAPDVPAERWGGLLPRVAAPDEAVGEVGAGGQDLGLPAGTVLAPGTGDNMAAALALALAPGDLALSLGTSGTAYVVSEHPTADATGAVAGFADATGRYLPLVCTLNATKATDAVARLLGVDHEGLDALALAASPGAGGVVLVPHLDGERTPDRPHATGTLAGLRGDVSRPQVARAAVEGVVCGLLVGVDALAAAGAAPDPDGRAVLVGGGARSAAYRTVVAGLLGRPVRAHLDDEVVAAGACVQAAAVLHGQGPDEVARAWALGHDLEVEPPEGVDAAGVRAAYAAAVERAGLTP